MWHHLPLRNSLVQPPLHHVSLPLQSLLGAAATLLLAPLASLPVPHFACLAVTGLQVAASATELKYVVTMVAHYA